MLRFPTILRNVKIEQEWDKLTEIEIELPMKIRRVIADKRVNDLTNKVALERGPLVYALEEIDNTIDVFDIALNDETQLAVEQHPALFNGIELITGAVDTGDKFTAIPYYAWGHRDGGKMTVWMNHK